MTQTADQQLANVEVAVIGGGAAGLTAAVTLARARRSVVVIDSGAPRNAPSDGIHMFLTRDGMKPADFVRTGRAEVVSYGGRVLDGEVSGVRQTAGRFELSLAGGGTISASRLLVTTGLVDELPDVPGVRELWGRDVHHCPYCHGYELRGRSVGVLSSGQLGLHRALLFRQLVTDLTLFVHDAPEPTAEESEQLAARGIRVVSGLVQSLRVVDGRLTGVNLLDGSFIAQQSLAVGPRMVARSKILTSLGLTTTQHPMGLGEFIAGDATGLTEVPGVWVAGNVHDLMASVVGAAAAGMAAAAAINLDLIAEDTRRAVAAYRISSDHQEHAAASA
jgi:thioredoxin reductase